MRNPGKSRVQGGTNSHLAVTDELLKRKYCDEMVTKQGNMCTEKLKYAKEILKTI